MTLLEKPIAVAGDALPTPMRAGLISRAIVAIVMACRRSAALVLIGTLLLTVVSGYYAANHFAINTDTNDFLSAKLPWRQRLTDFNKAFPQLTDGIVVVIDGKTPELAESATARLTAALRTRPDLFSSVERPDGGSFFNRNGLLFLPTPALEQTAAGLRRAQPFLAALSMDPSLRGLMDAFSSINRGVRAKAGTLDDFDRPIAALGDAFDSILADRPTYFSWHALLTGAPPDARELRRFINIKPVLDYTALEPGQAASSTIRKDVRDLGLAAPGVRVRLTGEVPLADEEFATVADGAGLNGAIAAVIVLFIIWRALRSPKIVLAVALTVVVGLAVTAAVGLMMVSALNLISVAFAVLFVGIGVDFGIQFSVRYRAERHDHPDFDTALRSAAAKAGRPLALAAVATTAGFYSFLPTDYRGVSELGLIAGTGMIIAFLTSITVLPALLTLMRPPAEQEPVGYKFLAPVDAFLSRHRYAIVIGTLAVALAGTPLLRDLRFDFNPLNLRSNKVESVSTVLDLMKDPNTDEINTVNILAPSIGDVGPLAARLAKLPEVARVTTLDSFVPNHQDEKLAIVQQAAAQLGPALDPSRALDPSDDEDDVAAMRTAAAAFAATAGTDPGKGADDARRLAGLIQKMAAAAPQVRDRARQALLPGLKTTLDLLRESLTATAVTPESIPAAIKATWVAADGRARIEVAPTGDPNDNATMTRFVAAVEAIDPDATGAPIAIQESSDTVVKAFVEAGIWALLSIAVILYVVLRRIIDVLLTLVPLLLAGLVTLEITVLIHLPLNFANIIALPLLLGLGVAFKIYFVMAWRAGTTNLLQSSLTRAVFFSALTTATAFGSLWLSNHPGTSSMGKLLALSLCCTLAAAILFQPALMGPPRKKVLQPEGNVDN